MAGPTGFEPATSRLTIWRPNQLNDGPSKLNVWQNDVTDKTISSGWSRLKFLFSYSICPVPLTQHFPGRRNRDRTCDIHRVKVALCQLSYPPDFVSNLRGCYQLHLPLSIESRTLLAFFCHYALLSHESRPLDYVCGPRRRFTRGKYLSCTRFRRPRSICV